MIRGDVWCERCARKTVPPAWRASVMHFGLGFAVAFLFFVRVKMDTAGDGSLHVARSSAGLVFGVIGGLVGLAVGGMVADLAADRLVLERRRPGSPLARSEASRRHHD
jgi:hypothetical protein